MDKPLGKIKRLKDIIIRTLLLAILPFAQTTLAQQLTTYTYSDDGLVLSEDGLRSDVADITTYTYDIAGNRTSITNALGHITQLLDHNGRGQPGKIIDPNGIETVLIYNVRGWLESITIVDPSGDLSINSITQYEYDGIGQLIKVTLPNGVVINYAYDGAGRLTSIGNNLGESITYTLDKAGNRIAEAVANNGGAITYSASRAFDELSRVMNIIGAESQTTHLDYDVNNNIIATTNPRAFKTDDVYDPLDRVSQSTDPNGGITQFAYDTQGRLTSVADANSNVTTYTYDAYDNVIQIDSPDTGTTTYTYDDANNLLSWTYPRNGGAVTIHYRYDVLNRLVEVTYPLTFEDDGIRYSYDNTANGNYGIGRITAINSQIHGDYSYQYDYRGNVIKKVFAYDFGVSEMAITTYEYDLGNNLTKLVYPSGQIVNYAYDSQGRVSGITTQAPFGEEQTVISNIVYLPYGPMANYTSGNGVVTTINYDQDYRVSDVNAQGAAAALLHLNYGYDLNSNIVQLDDSSDKEANQLFDYDALDRLIDATGKYGQLEHEYDLVGNRTKQTITTNSTDVLEENYNTVFGSNQLESIDKNDNGVLSNRQFERDDIGSVTRDIEGSTSLGYRYNGDGRIERVSITPEGGSTTTITTTYNYLGQRIYKSVFNVVAGSFDIFYHYNESGQLIAENNVADTTRVEYIYLNGFPVATLQEGFSLAHDSDGDGVNDESDSFPNDPAKTTQLDTDGDGVPDSFDAFPNNPEETLDTDGDGVGDNADAFPSDPAENADTDGDGVGDNADIFPNDPERAELDPNDSDGDGVPNSEDAFPNDPAENTDSDGDGVGNNTDAFPNNPNRTRIDNPFRERSGILREVWLNTGENGLEGVLSYPELPDSSEQLTAFEGPTNVGDNYGARISGVFYPPVTGEYVFWIAGDERADLLLIDSGGDRKFIAFFFEPTQPREWARHSGQRSAPINLIAGQPYYLQAQHDEKAGADHIAVAWQQPGEVGPTVIDVSYFVPPGEVDSDRDGVIDSLDAFPNDPQETLDTDGDGVGDNADAFPADPERTINERSGILREVWSNIGSGVGVGYLTDLTPDYPNSPTYSEQLTLFEGPTNVDNNYGSRISGHLYPPVTGEYTFWVSGDDNVELWLSSSTAESNKTRIAHVPGWTRPRKWTKYPAQRSVTINLVAGKSYYIEALHKEQRGGDNIAVSWQIPGGVQEVITSNYFRPSVENQ